MRRTRSVMRGSSSTTRRWAFIDTASSLTRRAEVCTPHRTDLGSGARSYLSEESMRRANEPSLKRGCVESESAPRWYAETVVTLGAGAFSGPAQGCHSAVSCRRATLTREDTGRVSERPTLYVTLAGEAPSGRPQAPSGGVPHWGLGPHHWTPLQRRRGDTSPARGSSLPTYRSGGLKSGAPTPTMRPKAALGRARSKESRHDQHTDTWRGRRGTRRDGAGPPAMARRRPATGGHATAEPAAAAGSRLSAGGVGAARRGAGGRAAGAAAAGAGVPRTAGAAGGGGGGAGAGRIAGRGGDN